MNFEAMRAIYRFEMARTGRTLLQSIVSPVISTSLYFVVFGAAIGSRMTEIQGVSYGAFIVPGLIMLSLLTEAFQCILAFTSKFTGTIYELLSAPVSPFGDRNELCRRSGKANRSFLALSFWRPRRFCTAADSSSAVDAAIPPVDGGDVQSLRFHYRHLG